jgi:hypothetical protein
LDETISFAPPKACLSMLRIMVLDFLKLEKINENLPYRFSNCFFEIYLKLRPERKTLKRSLCRKVQSLLADRQKVKEYF